VEEHVKDGLLYKTKSDLARILEGIEGQRQSLFAGWAKKTILVMNGNMDHLLQMYREFPRQFFEFEENPIHILSSYLEDVIVAMEGADLSALDKCVITFHLFYYQSERFMTAEKAFREEGLIPTITRIDLSSTETPPGDTDEEAVPESAPVPAPASVVSEDVPQRKFVVSDIKINEGELKGIFDELKAITEAEAKTAPPAEAPVAEAPPAMPEERPPAQARPQVETPAAEPPPVSAPVQMITPPKEETPAAAQKPPVKGTPKKTLPKMKPPTTDENQKGSQGTKVSIEKNPKDSLDIGESQRDSPNEDTFSKDKSKGKKKPSEQVHSSLEHKSSKKDGKKKKDKKAPKKPKEPKKKRGVRTLIKDVFGSKKDKKLPSYKSSKTADSAVSRYSNAKEAIEKELKVLSQKYSGQLNEILGEEDIDDSMKLLKLDAIAYNHGLKKEYETAIVFYDAILRIDPDFKNAYDNRDECYEQVLEKMLNPGS